MNTFSAIVLGFTIGSLAAYAAIRYLLGGLTYLAMRAVHEESPHAEEASIGFAAGACYAHAALLDDFGDVGAAGKLMAYARHAWDHPLRHLAISDGTLKRLQRKYDYYVHQGELGEDDGHSIHCHEHGSSRWAGHVRCLRCRHAYEPSDGQEAPAPAICACGYRLLPDPDNEQLPSCGAPICKHCFTNERNDLPQVVKAPDPIEQDRPLEVLPSMLHWSTCSACHVELYLRFTSGRPGTVEDPPQACPACGHTDEEKTKRNAE